MAPSADVRPILITGASGSLGRLLAAGLAEKGWRLRLTDRVPFPDPLPKGSEFITADLIDSDAILRLAKGCSAIVHFGAEAKEVSFLSVLTPNIIGLHNCYEAARLEGLRMVLASSSHVVGFYDRTVTLTVSNRFRPDGFYGLSKAYGELMGQLYWDKHHITSVCLRIGSCRRKPTDRRMLSTWLSHRDLISLVDRSLAAEAEGCHVIWGASRNQRIRWWTKDARKIIGWSPQDNADDYYDQIIGRISRSAIAERHQGGAFCGLNASSPSRPKASAAAAVSQTE